MRLRICSFVFASYFVIGCGAGATDRPPPSATSESAAGGPASAATAIAAATSSSAAGSPGVGRVPIDAPATLARLPENAAVYGWIRPVAGDALAAWSSEPDLVRQELAEALPGGSVRGLLAALGVEPGAPIAFAVTGPERAPIEKVVKSLAGGKSPASLTRDIDALPANGVHVRLVARAADGADVVAMVERTAAEARIDVTRCPGHDGCAALPGAALVLMWNEFTAVLSIEGARVEIDAVRGRGSVKKLVALLAEKRRAPLGGPKGRCSKLDMDADLAVCVDADRAAEMGAATGLWMTFSAVDDNGGTFDAGATKEVARVGMTESLRNVELASPTRRLLDDGTVNIHLTDTGAAAVSSWELTQQSKAGLEKQLAAQRCAAPAEMTAKLLRPLLLGFGDRGADFRKVNERLEHLREAGFGGYLVLFARTWPNFLGLAESPSFALGRAPLTKACAKTVSGRLEVELSSEKVPLDRL
jgi:hypothetical protein